MDTRLDLVERRGGAVAEQTGQTLSRDADAILAWVDSYAKESLNTRRKLRLEGLRWLAWLEARLGSSHADLLARASVADVTAYVAHLEHPIPLDPLILAVYGLDGSTWRGLKANSSLQNSVAVLSGLYEHLRRQPGQRGTSYLSHNPFAGASRRLRYTDERPLSDKAVSRSILDEVFVTIERLPRQSQLEEAHYWRCRWLFNLLFRLWLRRAEAASLSMGDFEPRGRDSDGKRKWGVRVTGKGRKTKLLPAHPALMEELIAYRRSHGLSDLPLLDDPMPALLPLRLPPPPRPKRPRGRPRVELRAREAVVHPVAVAEAAAPRHLSPSSVYAIVKTIFAMTDKRLRANGEYDPSELRVLEKASPHTMRHTGVTDAIRQGMKLHVAQRIARHVRGSTTGGYTTVADDEMADEMRRLN